jgi:hypothetical protein
VETYLTRKLISRQENLNKRSLAEKKGMIVKGNLENFLLCHSGRLQNKKTTMSLTKEGGIRNSSLLLHLNIFFFFF